MNNVDSQPKPVNEILFNISGMEIATKAKDAAINGVKTLGVTAKDSVITIVKDTSKFIIGINNLENAYQFATEKKVLKIVEIKPQDTTQPSLYQLEPHSPSKIERLRNASGELTIAGAKVGGLGSIAFGGLCKLGTGVIPCESITLGDAASMIYEGAAAVGSLGVEAGKGLLNHVAIPIYNSAVISDYAMPVLGYVGSVLKNNVVNSAAAVSTTALLYSANNDLIKMDEKIFDAEGNSVNGTAHKIQYATTATVKGLSALAIGLGTLWYNF